MIAQESEKVLETESNIEIIDIAAEYVNNIEVLNDKAEEHAEVDKNLQTEPTFQEEILSDNKKITEEDPEEESEFSFVELVKDTSKKMRI